MRSIRHETITLSESPDTVFGAALGVMQSRKNIVILAVHTGGHKLVVREKSKLSNPKFVQVWLEGDAGSTQLHVTVGTDPRTQKALLDGRANGKALERYLDDVRGALDGSAPAAPMPVEDHYVQKKDKVPWTDPNVDPDIEVGGNFLAYYGV